MNAYELADFIDKYCVGNTIKESASMLRQQADELNKVVPQLVKANGLIENLRLRIAKYEQVLQSIANEKTELSHDKIKWQCEDHIRWAKEALE